MALLLGLAAHGCSFPPPPTPGGAPSEGAGPSRPGARPRAGYEGRVDSLVTGDAVALAGRRIAIDPGHGGFFRGALGVHGLTEAEVNLGVALYLRGLLEAHGATVFMTRTDDRDFLTPADSSLRSDLAERMRLANGFHPDLFVSVHHNADARGAHDKNETQTYYKLGDDGPSLDAARSVHRFLVRNLGIDQHRILPGNYFVLRNSEAPAILTESSYITNPDVESKLALAAKQRLEAEAIYLGLARYFALPRPAIEGLAAERPEDRGQHYDADDGPRIVGEIRGPFDFATITVDGQPLAVSRGYESVEADGSALGPGPHTAVLRAGFAGGGSAVMRSPTFTIRRRPDRLKLDLVPPDLGQGLVGARVAVVDSRGVAVRDSARVRIRATGLAPSETTVVIHGGEGWGYFRQISRLHAPGPVRAETIGGAASRATVEARFLEDQHQALYGGTFVRLMPGDSAFTIADSASVGGVFPINRDGFTVAPLYKRVPGYRPWVMASPQGGLTDERPHFTAIAGGALHGRRITIDPDGGGDDDAGTGRSGTRAANVNLEVARALAAFLDAAGATTRLTRDGDFALSDVERVQVSEAFHADRFVRIAHRAEKPMIGYYFSSAADKRWAERQAAMFGSLGLPTAGPAEDAQYVLQQTSCPSIYVSASRIDDAAAEERLSTPAGVRAEAYAIYLALIGEWRDAPMPLDSLSVADASGRAVPAAAVTFGGSILLLTGPDGRVRFARTEPGPLDVDVESPAVRAHRVLLDSAAGVTVTGPGNR